jgi:L-aspartate semialdehyde sulfurtransferase
VGIGIPIPILNEEMVKWASIPDEEIYTSVVDYSSDYPQRTGNVLGKVNYAQLKSGEIKIRNKKVQTGSLSSYKKAREIANTLKDWIKNGSFLLTEKMFSFPSAESSYKTKNMKEEG